MFSVPTEFSTIYVLENLQLEDETSLEKEANTLTSIRNHIIGTESSDLSQIYNNPVTIRGTLTIKDLTMIPRNSFISVNGLRIPQSISETYWNIKEKQTIQVDEFTLSNNDCKANSLVTRSLNAIPVADFVLLNSKEVEHPVKLVFQKSQVTGDIQGVRGNNPSLLFLLNATAIPINGPPTVVQSSIDFQEAVRIRNLRTNLVNDIPTSEFCHSKSSEFSFREKIIEELETSQITVVESSEVERINDVNLLELPSTAVRIDQPIQLENLRVETFDAISLQNNRFENQNMDVFLSELDKEFSARNDSSTSRRVKVAGSCNFLSNIFAKSLNGPSNIVNDLFNFLVLKNNEEVEVGGVKTFKDLTILQNLKANAINKFPIDRLLHMSLSTDERQTFDGEVFVEKLQVKHLQARLINNISHSEFIDKTSENMDLNCNLKVKKMNVKNVHVSSSSFDVKKMLEFVENPPKTDWSKIIVDDIVEMGFGEQTYLDHLVNFAVLRNGPPKQITGQVTLDSSLIYFTNLIKDDYTLNCKSQPINIFTLYHDSVKNQSATPQVVLGIKQFIEPFYLKNARVQYNALFEVNVINDVKVHDLNASIHRTNDLIVGEKQFYNLQVENLFINGLLSGIAVEKYVALYPEFLKFNLPRLHIKYLHVGDLNVYNITGVIYKKFLADRFVCNSHSEQLVTGPINFKSVDVHNDSVLAYLNGVNVNDIATTYSDHVQVIHGVVAVNQGVHVEGPCNVQKLDDRTLDDVFENSVNRTLNYKSDYLKTKDLELNKGLIVKQSIGKNVSLETLTHSTPKLKDLVATISGVRSHIDEITGSALTRPGRRLYIDFDKDIQISPNLQSKPPADSQNVQEIIQPVNHNIIQLRLKESSTDIIKDLPSAKVHVMRADRSLCGNHEFMAFEIRWTFKHVENQEQNVTLCGIRPISSFDVTETKSGEVFVVLVMESEVDLIRLLPENASPMSSVVRKLKSVTKITFVESPQNNYMVISSFNNQSSFVKSFIYRPNQTQFVDTQQKIPSESFDVLVSININHISFLLMARSNHKNLLIYRLNDDKREFNFLKKITFDDGIKEIVIMPSQHETPSFIVSVLNGQFCTFEWRGIESWKSMQCGFFKRISSIQPYQHLERSHLFIANQNNDATALTLFRQGDRVD